MLKFIYELAIDPLGLPIEWYYEWIILGIIDYIAYIYARDKVGYLYNGDLISGSAMGSLCHWIIRTLSFCVIWAIAYMAILIGKIVLSHRFEVGIFICIIISIIVAKNVFNSNESKELAKVKVRNK